MMTAAHTKAQDIYSLCRRFEKRYTHSVVQLTIPSSLLIFFVHCVIGHKIVDSRDNFQLFMKSSHTHVALGDSCY